MLLICAQSGKMRIHMRNNLLFERMKLTQLVWRQSFRTRALAPITKSGRGPFPPAIFSYLLKHRIMRLYECFFRCSGFPSKHNLYPNKPA